MTTDPTRITKENKPGSAPELGSLGRLRALTGSRNPVDVVRGFFVLREVYREHGRPTLARAKSEPNFRRKK